MGVLTGILDLWQQQFGCQHIGKTETVLMIYLGEMMVLTADC
jgi:hypothetical protein